MGDDLLLEKAVAFTDTEIETMQEWLRAALAGDRRRADAVLRAGLLFEHYRSLLHEDAGQQTAEQQRQLELLKVAFQQALELPVTPVPEPPTKPGLEG